MKSKNTKNIHHKGSNIGFQEVYAADENEPNNKSNADDLTKTVKHEIQQDC